MHEISRTRAAAIRAARGVCPLRLDPRARARGGSIANRRGFGLSCPAPFRPRTRGTPIGKKCMTVGHTEMAPILMALGLILLAGRLGGWSLERLGQPAVLGELLAGVLLGNLGLLGFHRFDGVRALPAIDALAQLGALLLLFRVGLETDLVQMMAVGASSLLVAVLGVVAPMVLGFFVTRAFFATHGSLADWFVGATLCATSVGITARVLADLGRADSREGRIILGAAGIDDVLGLIVLAVLSGLLAPRAGEDARQAWLWIPIKAVAPLVSVVLLGKGLAPRLLDAARARGEAWILTSALALCFALAWLAAVAGLAPIVGAFAAGLLIDDSRVAMHRPRRLTEILEPLAAFLVPVFFVL